MRNSTRFLILISALSATIFAMGLHTLGKGRSDREERRVRISLVRELQLTDLCLFTEARYTRHPAMADLHSPFQDHPAALEHFPSGSLVPPPVIITYAPIP